MEIIIKLKVQRNYHFINQKNVKFILFFFNYNNIFIILKTKYLENSYQEFPTSDAITRRLKKLMISIIKVEYNHGKLNFGM